MKTFKLFGVDVSRGSYLVDVVIIGAESIEDLKEHWKNIDFSKAVSKTSVNYCRIYEIKNAFTDTPYTVL